MSSPVAPAAKLPFVVVPLSLGTFLMCTREYLVAGLLPQLASGLRVGVAQTGLLITAFAAGLAVSAFNVGIALGSWVAGYVVDSSLGERGPALVGTVMAAVGLDWPKAMTAMAVATQVFAPDQDR